MSQNVVYKTFELNTDVEHKAKPINLSGATTIKLTELPTGVKCWISTESNGTNLFPLINRGDGWVNMPNPLYNLYIYTEGTTLDNQKILLNFTGQNDFFAYGNNSSERIDKVGKIESFSHQALIDLNNAINNYYTLQEPIITGILQGEYKLGAKRFFNERYAILPFKQQNISDFNLDDDKFYRIHLMGHFDAGSITDNTDGNYPGMGWYHCTQTIQFCIFADDNGAVYSPTPSVISNEFGNDVMFSIDKIPYSSKQKVFDIKGIKDINYFDTAGSGDRAIVNTIDYGLNPNSDNFIMSGKILNQYDKIGILVNALTRGNAEAQQYRNLSAHASLIITISQAIPNYISEVKK